MGLWLVALMLYIVVSLASFYFIIDSFSFSFLEADDYDDPSEFGFPVTVLALSAPWTALVIVLNSMLNDPKEDEELINSYIRMKYRDTSRFDPI